ncbi:right-handed parallel beta-helix repeat-containing protein, partial [Methanobrevibacter sp.]|uniref:right-handed parallel beta-helix repeat-containing protein n=1 Tax=Methanobrevibacter sp. TaxID=66852 RepID=UPI003867B6F2
MKFKKSILILILAVFLLSIAGVCASDVNDTAMASHDDAAMESTDENLIMVEDSEPALSTAANEEIVSDSADDEIVSAENDLDVLSANPGTYSGLSSEIGTGGNIVLTHDNYTYDSGSTINITKSNSVIDGNGAIIDMAGSNIRAFKVTGSGVTIKNLTIINANATEDNDGAAIYFEKAGTVENCNFVNNYAGDAGAVYFKKANSKVINCNFTGNKAAFSGGAVCFKESGTVENCNFVNNVAASNNIGSGGAISFNGTGNVINCSFVNNSANGFSWAGAIYFNDGNVINCTFTNNKAWTGGAVGLYGNAKLENCSFDKNSANDGGAVEVIGAASIINCNFTDNKVLDEIYGYGGAVLWNTSAGNIKNCIFDKNAAFRGGAAYFEKDGEVTDCKFNDNQAADGGAVWFTEDGTVENSIFVKNEAWNEYGGGICFYTTGKIRNCSFTDSKAVKQGGAVYWNGAGTVENCNFTNNKAQDAGAIFFSEDSTVENCIFVKNSATDQRPDRYFGGAIVFYKNGDVTNSSFTENTAIEGGAVLFKGNGKAINCDFTNNSAQFGGAIDFESRATVENCNFNGNIASSNGSAIWVNRAGGTVSSSVFVNNRANSGIIFFKNEDSASDLTINDNIFLNNRGVAIYFAKNDSVSNADYNWFGNNATNYDIEPVNTNVKIGTWLFLNATANPDSIHLLGSSDIIFKLYAYTPSEVSEYDNSRLNPVSLTLTPTNGRVNATKTDLGKSVQYTPEGTGIDKLTATIENAAHTITLKITDGTTFYDLNHVINGNNNDTIVLDSDYTYNSTFDYNLNGGIVIDRAVTIIGNGHILDAAGLARIFNIQADNVVINNITFTNGKTNIEGGAICWSGANGNLSGCSFVNNSVNYNGGAIYWNGAAGGLVSDCSFVNNSGYNGGALFLDAGAGAIVSDCTFANNSADYGGAIFCDSGVGDVVSGCSFVNNTAGVGGAIYWWSSNEGLVYDCSFVNNSVRYYAAAIYWRGNDGNVSGCSFVNNSKYSIYFYNDENISHNLSINDNIFLNNTGVAIYFVNNDSSSNVDYNWFGNNATNYDIEPITNNAEMSTWLFLNATANQDAISILDSSDIIFKLYAYTPSGVSEYDNSRLKAVNLTLTPTNGRINTTKTELGEPVHYTAEVGRMGKLTASIENASYTISLLISDGTTFCDLNKTINGNDNDTIILDRDYTYNSIFDYNLNEGIVINRPLRIVGNGHTLNATGLARIFSIQANNVVIENITFVNGKTDRHGGAIFWSGNNANISDCIFVNNSADQQGAAINLDGDDSIVS